MKCTRELLERIRCSRASLTIDPEFSTNVCAVLSRASHVDGPDYFPLVTFQACLASRAVPSCFRRVIGCFSSDTRRSFGTKPASHVSYQAPAASSLASLHLMLVYCIHELVAETSPNQSLLARRISQFSMRPISPLVTDPLV